MKPTFSIFAFLLFALCFQDQPLRAGLIVTLMPSNPGPYDIADPASLTLNVDVMAQLDSNSPESIRIRLLRLDATDTDPAIGLETILTHDRSEFDIHFWDFSSTLACQNDAESCGDFHYVDATLEGDNTVELIHSGFFGPTPEYRIVLSRTTARRVGILHVSLPQNPGDYVLDLLNADEMDAMRGAELRHGYLVQSDPGNTTLRAEFGEITGGRLVFTVVPEPGTLGLVLLGTACLTRTRKKCTKTKNSKR